MQDVSRDGTVDLFTQILSCKERTIHSRVAQPESQIQHIILIILRLFQLVVTLGIEDDMTCGAGDRAFTGTFEVDVPFVCEGEEVVPLVAFYLSDGLALGVLESDLDTVDMDEQMKEIPRS